MPTKEERHNDLRKSSQKPKPLHKRSLFFDRPGDRVSQQSARQSDCRNDLLFSEAAEPEPCCQSLTLHHRNQMFNTI